MTSPPAPDSPEALIADAALVVAHPDDEILWFSSVANRVASTIICFSAVPSAPVISEGRKQALAQLPLPNLTPLGLTESEVFNCADWSNPRPNAVGLEVRRRPHSMPGWSKLRYRENFEQLRNQLRERLRGRAWVFTHNPWGEYGHEEHVQVFRAVESLRPELGYHILVSNYVSEKSAALFSCYAAGTSRATIVRSVDHALTKQIQAIYQRHHCWTWYDDYNWPEQECFIEWREPHSREQTGAIAPLNMVHTGWSPETTSTPKRLLTRARRAARRLQELLPGMRRSHAPSGTSQTPDA